LLQALFDLLPFSCHPLANFRHLIQASFVMGPNKSKPNAAEQRAQIAARGANRKDEVPTFGEQAREPVFDDDSMFNSADRQSAILQEKQARRTGLQKKEKKTADKPTRGRKAA
jgi:hypothetical protein